MQLLVISPELEARLIAGAVNALPVSGLTHNFYKYPARFSPAFARAAIEAFTEPGDLVLDPYVGGGTTLVEARALGRHALGTDISQLAEFVSKVKTTILEKREVQVLERWVEVACAAVNIHRPSTLHSGYAEAGYYKHLDHSSRWRLRKAIEQAVATAEKLPSQKMCDFARCVVLRTAQWALDGRKSLPSVDDFRKAIASHGSEMLASAAAFRKQVRSQEIAGKVIVINRSADGLQSDRRIKSRVAPKLIVTSPPYPGIHVLYHRWQVDGRKETAAPFWIANKLDGAGLSYYTMGDRKNPGLKTYFDNLRTIMTSLHAVSSSETIIAQMVAFQDASWQLPRYLETMEEVGFEEYHLPSLHQQGDGRLWRSVPGRRWYSNQRGETPGSNEVVLIHRKSHTKTAEQPIEVLTSRPRPST